MSWMTHTSVHMPRGAKEGQGRTDDLWKLVGRYAVELEEIFALPEMWRGQGAAHREEAVRVQPSDEGIVVVQELAFSSRHGG